MNVLIANKLPQSVRVSVLDAQGKAVEILLAPNGVSDPVARERITAHTKAMVAAGHVRIRPA